MAGLYLHVPFCKQACHYCDFHFSTDVSQRTELVEALVQEMILQKEYIGSKPLETVYFGGGTPSLLLTQELDFLLRAVSAHFSIVPHAEITLEANPDDLSPEKLRELRASGINRLSIGIQSFDSAILKFLNRAHDEKTARRCLEAVRDAGFNNVSIDLIYAIPGLAETGWIETLEEALQFSPEHISTYALTIEDRTVFGNWRKRGKLQLVNEERAARDFEVLMDIFSGAQLEHYEISNFCKPGHYSRHNSSYWKQTHYLGIGPGAHSYNGASRQSNVRNNSQYIRDIKKGVIPFEREVLTHENKINEYILTTLRTMWGCDLSFLKDQLHDDLSIRSAGFLSQIQQQGLATLTGNTLQLTQTGKLLADKIAADLMLPV